MKKIYTLLVFILLLTAKTFSQNYGTGLDGAALISTTTAMPTSNYTAVTSITGSTVNVATVPSVAVGD